VTDCKTKQYGADGKETDSKAGMANAVPIIASHAAENVGTTTAGKSLSRRSSFSHRAHAISFGVANKWV